MNMERDLVEAYQDEITVLQEEIQELKETYKENQKVLEYLSSVNINKALLSYHEKVVSQPGQIKDPVSVDLELDHCKKEIQFFNKISGIMFTKYFKKRVHKADNEDLYKHRLVGHCQSLTFQMEFESLDLTDKGGSCCDVTNLNIIMGSGEHSDLSNFVSRTEEKKNLLAFFRTLSSFADWSEYRRQTFVHFKEKYPSAIGLPVGFSGEYMVLRNPRLPGSELLLVWKIEIDEEGAVIPILDLLPKIPEQALALDKLGVIENAAAGFKTLLQACGMESSIENLILVFCLPETEDNEQ